MDPKSVTPETVDRLAAAAQAVAKNAYALVSGFHVGAAVLTADGEVYAGCNVENSSLGLTICAERNAVGQAVAAGARKIIAAAVWTPVDEPAAPCGACRQVLHEFGPDMTVVLVGKAGARRDARLSELLPKPFRFGAEGC
ncbi:MAG: cytidine deaminase [Planctomycetota bacterium]|jgi:cytidine deaminase